MDTALKIENLSASYEGKKALEGVSLDIPKNRITAVIGPSGCGKSTFLRCLNRFLEEETGAQMSGSVQLFGEDTAKIPLELLRRKIGMVFQIPSPFPFSIYRNMTYAPRYYGIHDRKKLDALVVEKLKLAGLYEEVKDDLNRSAMKLSGGQQQRLCIARALTVEPDVLLLDEPCSALDVRSSAVIEELLTELKQRYTIVVVTHNIPQARRIADHAVFLYNGRMIESGDAAKVLREPSCTETKEFLSGIFG